MPFGRPKKPRAPLNAAGLYNYAVGALGRQMRTEAELKRLMKLRAEPGEVGDAHIEAVLEKLCEQGYLNDAAFAETYTRLRREHEKLGERRVRQNLKQKGVAPELIDETLETGYAHVNEETQAREFIEKKRLKKPENEKESARLMRRLVTAGFSVGVIYRILRQWDVPDEMLMALDNLEEEINENGNATE